MPGVSGGGLIFAAILVGWAVFLLPQWLRRDPEVHLDPRAGDADHESDGHSRHRLHLPRRIHLPGRLRRHPAGIEADHGGSDVAAPAGPRSERAAPAGRTRDGGGGPRRATGAVVRRRRVVSVLAGATLVAGVAPMLVGAPSWLVGVPAVLLVAYLGLLLMAGRRAALDRSTPAVLGGRGAMHLGHRTGAHPHRPARPAPARASSIRPGIRQDATGQARQPVAVADPDEQLTGPIECLADPAVAGTDAGTALGDATTAEAGADTSPEGASWAPVSVPLPTYVTAPKARRTIRSIDLSAPGSWTSGRLDPAEAEAYAAALAESGDVDALADPTSTPAPAADPSTRRAVGG